MPLQDGVPRGAYRGVVPFRSPMGARIFLAPTLDVDFTGQHARMGVLAQALPWAVLQPVDLPRRLVVLCAVQPAQRFVPDLHAPCSPQCP